MFGQSLQYTKTKLLTSFSNIRYNTDLNLIDDFECFYPNDYKYSRKVLQYLECAKLHTNVPLTNSPNVVYMEGEVIINPYCIVHNDKAYFGSNPLELIDKVVYSSSYVHPHPGVVTYISFISVLTSYFIYNLF